MVTTRRGRHEKPEERERKARPMERRRRNPSRSRSRSHSRHSRATASHRARGRSTSRERPSHHQQHYRRQRNRGDRRTGSRSQSRSRSPTRTTRRWQHNKDKGCPHAPASHPPRSRSPSGDRRPDPKSHSVDDRYQSNEAATETSAKSNTEDQQDSTRHEVTQDHKYMDGTQGHDANRDGDRSGPSRHDRSRHRRGWRNDRRTPRGRSGGGGGFRNKKLSIPDNWEDVPKMGDLMQLTPFIALRVPLDDKYTVALKDREDHWSPKDFCQEQEARGLNIRMIIDLTNTFRYYNGNAEFNDSSIEYVKLRIEGFKQPPNEQDVTRFIEIVEKFQAKDPEGRIGVHCTHGLNRTGYLIVSYLVRKLGWTVTKALDAFSLARPPGLIKHQYVEHLYQLFGEQGETVQLPAVPEWAQKKYTKALQRPHVEHTRAQEPDQLLE